jgi:hypothetical protein
MSKRRLILRPLDDHPEMFDIPLRKARGIANLQSDVFNFHGWTSFSTSAL